MTKPLIQYGKNRFVALAHITRIWSDDYGFFFTIVNSNDPYKVHAASTAGFLLAITKQAELTYVAPPPKPKPDEVPASDSSVSEIYRRLKREHP